MEKKYILSVMRIYDGKLIGNITGACSDANGNKYFIVDTGRNKVLIKANNSDSMMRYNIHRHVVDDSLESVSEVA